MKALILSLDSEKALDSVSWQYLFHVLFTFGFSEIMINSIKAIYDNPMARIKINGHLSEPLMLERGVRQGCAWSPLLFAMFLEPLAQHIRQSNKIKGRQIKQVDHKIACYADNVLLYLRKPEMSLPEFIMSLKNFGSISGYKLNVNETETPRYNFSPCEKLKETYPLRWKTDSFKYLRVILPQDLSKICEKNVYSLSHKIKEDLIRSNLIPFLNLSTRIETIKINILPNSYIYFKCSQS